MPEKKPALLPKKENSNVIFETTDRYNIIVSLSRNTWEGKILKDHPEVADYIKEAQTTIEDPNVISIDSKRDTTKIFSKIGLGRGEYENNYLRAIVQYAGVSGRVASIYFADTLPKGKITWVKKSSTI